MASAQRDLIERLRKRAKEDQACADNSAVIVEALAGQMELFENRNGPAWNTYAVRMAVDHRNSVKRDTQYARDLTEAADALEAANPAEMIGCLDENDR